MIGILLAVALNHDVPPNTAGPDHVADGVPRPTGQLALTSEARTLANPPPSTFSSPTPDITAISPTQSIYLFDLSSISGSYDQGAKTVGGQTYGRSVFHGVSQCNSGDGTGHSVEYSIGRKYKKFVAFAGLSDTDTRGPTTVQFRVDTDSRHQYFTSGRGESHAVMMDITGDLFLRLTVYEPNGSGPCIVDAVAVWGDAQLLV